MSEQSPILFWFRRDLRTEDHPGLCEAVATGRPVIPVFLNEERLEVLGAAAKWRMGEAVASFADLLDKTGSRLILRRGKALVALRGLIEETGAGAVWWSRAYDPATTARDAEVKSALKEDGIDARSFAGHVLFEPWTVETQTGGYYRVYSPMWKAVKDTDVGQTLAPPQAIPAPETWPKSDALADWALDRAMNRGAEVLKQHACVGQDAARARLEEFVETRIADYKKQRDFPGVDATSNLSENLTYGEISARTCWHAGWRAVEEGKAGAEHFLKELVWREFAYHLVYHTPHIVESNWREGWDSFPWNEDEDREEVIRWKQGRTGVPFVDAAMREMYVTGRMHNRARMIVASYLTKHLMTHWKVGMRWFDDCLTDWDPASNAMGWQWVAGSGPDAAPYFRVFNAETQLEKFDGDQIYQRRWIAEGRGSPSDTALSYFDAVPRSWALSPDADYPGPVVDMAEGRERALAAYEAREF